MASAGGSTDEDDYLSSCGICFGKYDLSLNRPKVLPCSHTFCFTCIQAMINNGTPLKCPMCRHQIAVGIDGVESLPNNVFAEHNILLNNKLQKAEAETKLSSKLLDAFIKSKKSDCQVFVITDDQEPKILSFNASKDAVNNFHQTSKKISIPEKSSKLRVISWQGFMCNDIPQFDLLMTSLVKILKSQNPDVVFLYNVEPTTLDRLRKSLPDFKFIYEFHTHQMSVTLLNTSVSYDSHEAVQLPIENSCCYDYLIVNAHVGSLKLKLINAEIDMYAEDQWREDLTKMILNELRKESHSTVNIILRMDGCCHDQNWNTYQLVNRLPYSTVDVWEACKKPRICNHIWRYNKPENVMLKYQDFNTKSPTNDQFRLSRVYLRPATSVFAKPKFHGVIQFLNITPAPYLAILVDFDILSK